MRRRVQIVALAAFAATLGPFAASAQSEGECSTTDAPGACERAQPLAAAPADDQELDEERLPPPAAAPPLASSASGVAAEIVRPALDSREGLYLSASAGPSLMVRGHGSGRLHLSPGGLTSLRLGAQLRPQVVVSAGIDLYVYRDEASCGDCIYDATGAAAAITAALRIYPAAGPVWLELDAGLALHVVDGSRSVGPTVAAAVGWEVYRRGRTSVSLEARVAPMFFYLGGYEVEPIVVPATLSLGVVH